jgi:hypothetical protein
MNKQKLAQIVREELNEMAELADEGAAPVDYGTEITDADQLGELEDFLNNEFEGFEIDVQPWDERSFTIDLSENGELLERWTIKYARPWSLGSIVRAICRTVLMGPPDWAST